MTHNLNIYFLGIVFLIACANTPDSVLYKNQDDDVTEVTTLTGGSEFAIIEFEKGSHALTQNGQATLQKVARVAQAEGRKVDEIKVLAWADRDYPEKGVKADRRDINLADDRASVIKTYLKDDLDSTIDIEKHNMALRPSAFGELVKSEDYRIKNDFEITDATKQERRADGKPDVLSQKFSKAIIVIKYE
ncbi:MAG: hypothetical protein A2622_12545 [Bdellovibrionales bacterium RIFCSPHIGHO2_01_FULL_40_29]|nr:MAG: hypothetical protein A2622_12545 [Bdellovibrionales bacterium RIFCSPHIGHO2_01_FULL_40_29]OFZ33010.1 MAG: hypothetical protein A3D17_09850 [Bdellovibrionales bacterium RIFCSPHIGHO2_02_FULL_40_15]